MPDYRHLADSFSRTLSENALSHLRRSKVLRDMSLATPAESLRALLLDRRFDAPDVLVDLEARAGGALFPRGELLGAFCFLKTCPSLAPRELPVLHGERAFPVFGNPELLVEEWIGTFAVMTPSGAMGLYSAPWGPVPAFSSLDHFLELQALAPISPRLHSLRVDGFVGGTVADLLSAYAHPPAESPWTRAWIGRDLWVSEMRLEPLCHHGWGSHRGTFIATEQPELLVDVAELLLEQGHSLGHRGPTTQPPAGATPVLSFVEHNPELGYRAKVRVTIVRHDEGYSFTHQLER